MPTKSIFTSRTFAGLALVALPLLAQRFGFKLDDAATQEIVAQIFQAIGLVVAAYGRLKATQPVTITGAPKLGAGLLLLLCASLLSACYLTACANTSRSGRVTNAALLVAGKFAGKVILSSAANALSDRAAGLQIDYAHAASEGLWTNLETAITGDDIRRIVDAYTAGNLPGAGAQLGGRFAALGPVTPGDRSAVVAAMATGITDAALRFDDRTFPLPTKAGLAK